MTADRHIAEDNDRRLPATAPTFEVCPSCGCEEAVRAGLALVCGDCGAIIRPAEDAA